MNEKIYYLDGIKVVVSNGEVELHLPQHVSGRLLEAWKHRNEYALKLIYESVDLEEAAENVKQFNAMPVPASGKLKASKLTRYLKKLYTLLTDEDNPPKWREHYTVSWFVGCLEVTLNEIKTIKTLRHVTT